MLFSKKCVENGAIKIPKKRGPLKKGERKMIFKKYIPGVVLDNWRYGYDEETWWAFLAKIYPIGWVFPRGVLGSWADAYAQICFRAKIYPHVLFFLAKIYPTGWV